MKSTQKRILVSVLLLATLTLEMSGEAKSEKVKNGEATYMANCEACHMAGKNVLKPRKDIVTSNKINNLKEFEKLLSEKHGLMPAFPQIIANKKVLASLFKYVKTLKDQVWEYYPPVDDEKLPLPPQKSSGDKELQ